jgi:hypothetical protein
MGRRSGAYIAFATVLLSTLLWGPTTQANQTVGKRPPALAPYAEDDPIPKLTLNPHKHQATARQAAESFLAYLSNTPNIQYAPTGGTVPGLTNGWARAWELLASHPPTLDQFKAAWPETARLGVIQLEPMRDDRFFVELQRVEYCGDHWSTSFYSGEVMTTKVGDAWRIKDMKVSPEDLVRINIGGHPPAWIHEEGPVAARFAFSPTLPPNSWNIESVRYERRTAIVSVRLKATGETKTVRLARTVEGTWYPLGVA